MQGCLRAGSADRAPVPAQAKPGGQTIAGVLAFPSHITQDISVEGRKVTSSGRKLAIPERRFRRQATSNHKGLEKLDLAVPNKKRRTIRNHKGFDISDLTKLTIANHIERDIARFKRKNYSKKRNTASRKKSVILRYSQDISKDYERIIHQIDPKQCKPIDQSIIPVSNEYCYSKNDQTTFRHNDEIFRHESIVIRDNTLVHKDPSPFRNKKSILRPKDTIRHMEIVHCQKEVKSQKHCGEAIKWKCRSSAKVSRHRYNQEANVWHNKEVRLRLRTENVVRHSKESPARHIKETLARHNNESAVRQSKEPRIRHSKESIVSLDKESIVTHSKKTLAKHNKEPVVRHSKEARLKHRKESIVIHNKEIIATHSKESLERHNKETLARHKEPVRHSDEAKLRHNKEGISRRSGDAVWTGRSRGGAILLCILLLLSLRGSSGSASLGAQVVCARAPLTEKQRALCRASPAAMAAIATGLRMAYAECRSQLSGRRWNCSGVGDGSHFSHVMPKATREAAFTYAITSAGVTHALSSACARGDLPACGCPHRRRGGTAWEWGGGARCGEAAYGARLARRFLDARELERDARAAMNLHNNRLGRKLVKELVRRECKCHGVSGSCAVRTCWRALPPLHAVGTALRDKYLRAKMVTPVERGASVDGRVNIQLLVKRPHVNSGGGGAPRAARKSELVYLEASPSYCERDPATDTPGTHGRFCNNTSKGEDGCETLCCGRGYNTVRRSERVQCRCRFQWCCRVRCDYCLTTTEQHVCN